MDLYVGVNSLNYTIGYATDAKVVYGNTNSAKYFAATVNGVSYKFYNSAVYMSGSTTYLLVLTEGTGYCTYKANGSSGGGFAITSQGNGVYTSEYGIVGYDNIIRNSAEGTTKIISANIPIFYDYSAYLNYITNPIEEPILLGYSAGGGGLYGGYRADTARGGGAGSGYIGNSDLSNKKMVGYNVTTSSDTATKTETTDTYSAVRETDTPKAGNGFAKITFLRALSPDDFSFIKNINNWYVYNRNWLNWLDGEQDWRVLGVGGYWLVPARPKNTFRQVSYIGSNIASGNSSTDSHQVTPAMGNICNNNMALSDIMTVQLTTQVGGSVTAEYTDIDVVQLSDVWWNGAAQSNLVNTYTFYTSWSSGVNVYPNYNTKGVPEVHSYKQTSFADLQTALEYIYMHYANINLYVDGDLWISVGGQS